uniref:Uncharacterized protein n=1 Tax=Anguilla anguilla TaxID=7936 RepID=A0A0E9XEG0_ANGAN
MDVMTESIGKVWLILFRARASNLSPAETSKNKQTL